ncbi:hypothetical protein [Methanofollis ethanolicus]|uniref:hypothetical protein n=1 Tax=Methanofollis ethanolicus TaxID=488124 RepID=UPI00128F0EA1|nr:hypothetical protein [Methanofollis ethanolicus]
MKKQTARAVTAAAGMVCVASSAAWRFGLVETWVSIVLTVVAFPFFLVALGLWWNAAEKEGDTPFIGY